PLEERRTQAVLNRRWSDPQSADDLGALDPQAIAAVRAEAWPLPGGADEMHEALMSLAAVCDAEVQANPGWLAWLQQLAAGARACHLKLPQGGGLWLARERLPWLLALYPQAAPTPLPGFDQ